VLGQPQAVNRAHEHAALAGQVADNLLGERRLEQVAGADGDAARQTALAGPAGGVLVDGVAGVDPLAFEEVPSDRRAGALRRDQNDVDVLGRHHAGLVAEDNAEAVREVQGLTGGQVRLEGRPLLLLAGVGEQVLHDGAAPRRLLQREQRLAGNPAVLLGQLPAAALVAQADDYVEAVVLHVERLAAALDAVAEDGDGFLAQDGPQPLRRIVAPLHPRFRRIADLDLTHARFLSKVSTRGAVRDRVILAVGMY